MKMREHLQSIYKTLTADETLLRLLYYKPSTALDDPLDPAKENVLDMDNKWEIIEDVIKTSKVWSDLDNNQKCRLLMFAGSRNPTRNYLIAEQDFIFDVFVHAEAFDNVDQRLNWICDTLSEILFDSRITGIGKVSFESGRELPAPNGYVGYRMVYCFGSVN